ncbi:MAG: NAD(P)/FAD-dependent oxidoreductase [Chloroflexota bacterium]
MSGPGPGDAAVRTALADARPAPFWSDRPDLPSAGAPLTGRVRADLAIVGAGFTGLWAAVEARAADPSASIVVLEAGRLGSGASGRNGGFLSASLTHGLAHGAAHWPTELPALLRLGDANIDAIAAFVAEHDIDADLRRCGSLDVATRPHEVAGLADAAALGTRYGRNATLLDADAVRADIASPTYLAGVRRRDRDGLIDPVGLVLGLARVARAAGVTIAEGSPVTRLVEGDGGAIRCETPAGAVEARRVLVATGGYAGPLRRMRAWILPVYDHVLMTEPLGEERWAALGWPERQGVSDSGTRFHYYRPTRDGRILWGGYDAVYHFGGRISAAFEERRVTEERLAANFLRTFPQLEGVRFTHRWAGVIETTSRFTPVFGTAFGGRVAYAAGYTGLGVGASRFGALVGLDLLAGRATERTRLGMVRRPPLPFPPEPLRSLVVGITQRALARQDVDGRRGAWLRLLDRFGVGFDS